MFTVKYVDEMGEENITEAARVIADKTIDGQPRVMIYDEIPNHHKCNQTGVYAADPNRLSDGIGYPTVYVMNRFGATVAKYVLKPIEYPLLGDTLGVAQAA